MEAAVPRMEIVGLGDAVLVLAWSRCSSQQAFGAEMFVDLFPLYAIASAAYSSVFSLGFCRVFESGIPGEWYGNGASVHQIHTQGVFVEMYI